MSVLVLILIFVGGSIAGVINTMAGGGSLITLPLLIFAGLPPTVANGTNRVAIVLQNVGALAGFRKNGLKVGREAWLLSDSFPGRRVSGGAPGGEPRRDVDAPGHRGDPGGDAGAAPSPAPPPPPEGAVRVSTRWWLWPVYFGVGVYGGFLQAGVGFFYLALLVGLQGLDLVRANLIKIFLILMYSILALALFLAEGKVALVPGLALAAGNALGGWVGAHLAVRKGESWIKVVLAVAVIVSAAQLTGLTRLLARLLGIGG